MYHKRYTCVRLQILTKLFHMCTINGTGVFLSVATPHARGNITLITCVILPQ